MVCAVVDSAHGPRSPLVRLGDNAVVIGPIIPESKPESCSKPMDSDVPLVAVSSFSKALIFASCAVCGALTPLVTGWAKTTVPGRERPELTFVQVSLVLSEQVFSLVIALAMTISISGVEGLRRCFDLDRLKVIAPMAWIYSAGDVLLLVIISIADAALFSALMKIKLIVTALTSRLVLGTMQTIQQWILLVGITVCCFLYADLDCILIKNPNGKCPNKAQSTTQDAVLFWAITLSLLKVFMESLCSVLTERAFKAAPKDPMWITQVQLKLVSTLCTLLLLWAKNVVLCKSGSTELSEACIFEIDGGLFHGWTWKVFILVMVRVINSFCVALVLKKMDSVTRCVAHAQSLWIIYAINLVIDDSVTFHKDVGLVVLMIVILCIAYGVAPKSPIEARAVSKESSAMTKHDFINTIELTDSQKSYP